MSRSPFVLLLLARLTLVILMLIIIDFERLSWHNLIKAMKPLFKKKEKTMSYNYYLKIYYIKNNNKADTTYTFNSRKEYKEFFDYILKLRYNKNSNIYDISFGPAIKVNTMTEAINELLVRGDVLLPDAEDHIDILDMEFEDA